MIEPERDARPHLIAVSGLAFEARSAAAEGIKPIFSGDRQQLAALLQAAVGPATRAIISFGFAGGLAPGVRPGTCIIADNVISKDECFATDPAWRGALLAAMPKARRADLAAVEHAVDKAADKRGLHARTGAVAVDMESHIAARIAQERGLPFVAVRVVLDPAERAVPQAALAGHALDGTTNSRAVMAALRRRRQDVPGVLRLAVDAWIASRALLRCRRQLGEGFAFVDVGHHLLDMA